MKTRKILVPLDGSSMAEAALDASLPGGLIEGSGDMRYAQTMAFTTLLFFSLFTVFTARSDVQSAFVGLSSNLWLWAAVLLSLALQLAVIYVPFLQQAFSTVRLEPLATGSSAPRWQAPCCGCANSASSSSARGRRDSRRGNAVERATERAHSRLGHI